MRWHDSCGRRGCTTLAIAVGAILALALAVAARGLLFWTGAALLVLVVPHTILVWNAEAAEIAHTG